MDRCGESTCAQLGERVPADHQHTPYDPRVMKVEGIIAEIIYSDGGQAAEADVLELNAEDNGPFVVLKSWYDEGDRESHEWLRSIENKRVRVTVEVL